jgi:hypothetical protein
MTTAIVVRASQLFFVGSFVWAMAALFDAIEKPHTIGLPPFWPVLIAACIGCSTRGEGRRHTSPVGDLLALKLADDTCPDCGQSVFDPSGPTGYASPSDREAYLPSRICANCGHDLRQRPA